MPKDLPTMEDYPPAQVADQIMKNALSYLIKEQKRKASEANDHAIMFLQSAMMWNNKDRTIKGEVKPYPTHVAANAEELTHMP